MRVLSVILWIAGVAVALPRKKYYRYSYMESIYYQSYHVERPSGSRCMMAAFRPISDRELLYRLLFFESSADNNHILMKGSVSVDTSFENQTCLRGLPIRYPEVCLSEVGINSGSYILFSDVSGMLLFGMVKDLSENDLVHDRLAAVSNRTLVRYEAGCSYSPFE